MDENKVERPAGCYKMIVIMMILAVFIGVSYLLDNVKEFTAVTMGIMVNILIVMVLQWRLNDRSRITTTD